MKLWKACVVALIVQATPLAAQQIKLPPALEKLSSVATDSVEVTLDSTMLKFASGFMSQKNGEEEAARKLLENLTGVYVRTFEFDHDNAYSPDVLNAIREQLDDPQWSRIVTVKEKGGEDVGVWLHRENEKTTGMVVLVTAPREITFVNLIGTIRPEDLTILGGQFGIPKIEPSQKKD